MFERYTDEAKRAIFFARQIALRDGAPAIDTTHILVGSLVEKVSRANIVFRLQELLPAETAQATGLRQQSLIEGKAIPLTNDGKRTVAHAAYEANRLRDYWIDVEHLILGIVRDCDNGAAARLRTVGLDLQTARQLVVAGKASRPARKNPVLWWGIGQSPSVLGTILPIVFLLGLILALILLGVGSGARR